MHPPLLKPVVGRPKAERHKRNGDKKKKKRKGNTSALFVETIDIIGITARGTDQRTLNL